MKRVMVRMVLVLAGLLALDAGAQVQQTIHLKDGRSLEGGMAALNDTAINWVLPEGEGNASIPLDQVDYIEFPAPPVWTQSMEAFEAGDYKKAATGFQRIVDQRKAPWTFYPAPGNFAALAQRRLLDCYQRLEDWKKLGNIAGTVEWAGLSPEERRAEPVAAVWAAIAAQEYKEAEKLADEALGKVPELVGELGLARSVMYRQQNDPEKAAIALSEVFGTFPGRDREASAAAIAEVAKLFRQYPDRMPELKALTHVYAGLFGEGKLWEGADPMMGKLLAEGLDVADLASLGGGGAGARENIKVTNGSFEDPVIDQDYVEMSPKGWWKFPDSEVPNLQKVPHEVFKGFSADGKQVVTMKEKRGIFQKIGAGAVEPNLSVEVRFLQFQQTNIKGEGAGLRVELWDGKPGTEGAANLSSEVFPPTAAGKQAERIAVLRGWSRAPVGGDLYLVFQWAKDQSTGGDKNVAIDNVRVKAEVLNARRSAANVPQGEVKTVFLKTFSGEKGDQVKKGKGWSGSPDWREDGSCEGKTANLWHSFSPEPGHLYRLSARVPLLKGESGANIGLGFAGNDDEKGAFSVLEPAGWLLLRSGEEEGTLGGGRALCGKNLGIGMNFGPTALKSPDLKTPAQIEMVLDTRPEKWEIDWMVDGKSVSGVPVALKKNPQIKFAGIRLQKGAEVKVSELKLTKTTEKEK